MNVTTEPTATAAELHPDICPQCGSTGVCWPDNERRVCDMCGGSGWKPGHAPGDLNPEAFPPPTPDTVIDRVYLHNGLVRVDTHTVVNGQRIGKTYYADGGKLYPMPVDIGVGDFVRSTVCRVVCGFVLRPAVLPFGKYQDIPVFVIERGDGSEDIIPQAETELIARTGDR